MEDKLKIHVAYIIAILVAIIVVLVSVEWSKVSGLVNYITFALTLSSLILAVLAIVYSMVSNTSFNNIIQRMNISSDHLQQASKGIDEGNRILLEEIQRIPAAIESVDKNVSSTRSMIESLSVKSLKDDAEETEVSKELSGNVVKNFVKESSVRGLQALYSVALSYKTKTAFTCDEICEEVPSLDKSNDYLLSYYIAARALGLISAEYDGKGRFIIEDIHADLVGSVESELKGKLQRYAKENYERRSEHEDVTEEQEEERWMKNLTEIQQFFGVLA